MIVHPSALPAFVALCSSCSTAAPKRCGSLTCSRWLKRWRGRGWRSWARKQHMPWGYYSHRYKQLWCATTYNNTWRSVESHKNMLRTVRLYLYLRSSDELREIWFIQSSASVGFTRRLHLFKIFGYLLWINSTDSEIQRQQEKCGRGLFIQIKYQHSAQQRRCSKILNYDSNLSVGPHHTLHKCLAESSSWLRALV